MASDRIAGTSVYLQPGMSIVVRCPIDPLTNLGYFAASNDYITKSLGIEGTGLMPYRGTPINGFVVANDGVGGISEAPNSGENGISVVYTHRVPEKNAIWFFAATGERGVVNVINVPIHDHSNITQGGPAYGTYFSDDEEV